MSRNLMLLLCVLFARSLLAQEEMPFFVDQPSASITAFTDWQEIKLTYTLHWLDGYRPQYEDAKPENMSFSPCELDPLIGSKLEKQNERKYKKENYIDLVYHIRCLNDKKGELPIPEHIFKYVKEGPDGSIENSEEKDFKAPGIMLRYDSVLPKDADDIIDTIDFGSFRKQEYTWKGLSAVPIILFVVTAFILFRKPTVLVSVKTKNLMIKKLGQNYADYQERLVPKEALKLFNKNLEQLFVKTLLVPNPEPSLKLLAQLHEELRQLLASYVPEVLDSDTPKQIDDKIANMAPSELHNVLLALSVSLASYENALYDKESITYTDLAMTVNRLKLTANYLKNKGKTRKLYEYLKNKLRRS